MWKEIRPALVLIVALTLITGLAYPLAITGLAQVLFPRQAAGSLIERDGRVIGSALIGQAFTSDRYFHGRPSATTAPDPSDPAKSVPAPYNAAQFRRIESRTDQPGACRSRARRRRKALGREPRRAGADRSCHHLGKRARSRYFPEAAAFQVPRIAKARNLSEDRIRRLVAEHTAGRLAGLIGEPRVNVLALNLALDAIAEK